MFERKGQSDLNEIAVIALEINHGINGSPEYKNYLLLSALDKIKLISKHINLICQHLQNIKPHAMWIVSWKEYGICQAHEISNSFPVSLDELIFFKEEMQKLTLKYRNLTIISGAIKVKCHFEKKDFINKIIKINKEYVNVDDISSIEKTKTIFPQIEYHLTKISNLKKNLPTTHL